MRLLCRANNGGCAGGDCRSCRCRRGRRTHRIACTAEDEGLCHAAGCSSCAGADTAGDKPRGHFGHEAEDVGTHEHAHSIHAVRADALQAQRAYLLP